MRVFAFGTSPNVYSKAFFDHQISTTSMERIPSITIMIIAVLLVPGHSVSQIPAEPTWGIECLWEEADYLDALGSNSYLPVSTTTVSIADVAEFACRPLGVDSLDIYGDVIPFFVNGELYETVELKPMYKTIYRDLVFENTESGLVIEAEQRILAIELLPYNADPLAQPYVYLGNGPIDYPALFAAITAGAGPDLYDGCGNGHTLSTLNVDGNPAILNTAAWGTGSRVACYWRCQGPAGEAKWYIQHVFVNDAPFVLPCQAPSSDLLDLSGCDQDFTPPLALGLDPIFLSCADVPPVQFPIVVDDFDSAAQVQYLGEEGSTGCYTQLFRSWGVSDACGNEAIYTQQIDINNENFLSLIDPPQDATIAADAVIDPEELAIGASCGPAYVVGSFATFTGNVVEVEVGYDGLCSSGGGVHTYTLTANSVEAFDVVPAEVTILLGEEPPAPLDTQLLSSNNPFFHFQLVQDTVFSEPPMECPLYTIRRTYTTLNGADELVEALTTVQLIEVNGDCSVGVGGSYTNVPQVVPNPTTGVFRLLGVTTPAQYVVLDVQGKVLRSGSLNGADPVVDLEGAASSGTYMLRLTTSDHVSNHRLVVEPGR
jgi:hypothetical protein